MVSAELASLRRPVLRVAGISLGLLVLYLCLPLRDDDLWWASLIVGLGAVVAVVPFTARRIRAVATAAHPGIVAAESVALMLVMVIIGLSTAYLAVDRLDGQFNGLDTRLDAVYFTVVTLSTVGFGDITATGQLARGIVVVQILLDVTVIAISAKLLVGAARDRIGPRR